MGYHLMVPPKLEDAALRQEEKEKLMAAEKEEAEVAKTKQASPEGKARL